MRAGGARASRSTSARAETEAFWTAFVRGLVKRGLVGVRLVISDAHAGLKRGDRKVPRLRVAALQRALPARLFRAGAQGPARPARRADPADLAADPLEQARDRLAEAVAHLDGRLSKIATMLEDAEPDILALYAFPAAHWRKLRCTNPLERFNKEIDRRTDVVGIFPADRSLIPVAGMLCSEHDDEWLVGRGYLSGESIALVCSAELDRPTPKT
jgi:transposase-like protein